MILRDRIVEVYKSETALVTGGALVRDLLTRMPGCRRASVSKECRFMVHLGLLTDARENNHHHGKRFRYRPTAILLAAGRLPPNGVTLLRFLAQPMTNKDLRYAMRVASGAAVTRAEIVRMLGALVTSGRVRVTGTRYVKASGATLADVARVWGARPRGGSARLGTRPA